MPGLAVCRVVCMMQFESVLRSGFAFAFAFEEADRPSLLHHVAGLLLAVGLAPPAHTSLACSRTRATGC